MSKIRKVARKANQEFLKVFMPIFKKELEKQGIKDTDRMNTKELLIAYEECRQKSNAK